MADVFISYARKDHQLAIRLAREFERAGYSTWHYRRGDESDDTVRERSQEENEEIESCRVVAVIISPDSVDNPNVYNEVNVASEIGKYVVPLLLRMDRQTFLRSRKKWALAVVAKKSPQISPDNVGQLVQRLTRDLESKGILGPRRLTQGGHPEPRGWRFLRLAVFLRNIWRRLREWTSALVRPWPVGLVAMAVVSVLVVPWIGAGRTGIGIDKFQQKLGDDDKRTKDIQETGVTQRFVSAFSDLRLTVFYGNHLLEQAPGSSDLHEAAERLDVALVLSGEYQVHPGYVLLSVDVFEVPSRNVVLSRPGRKEVDTPGDREAQFKALLDLAKELAVEVAGALKLRVPEQALAKLGVPSTGTKAEALQRIFESESSGGTAPTPDSSKERNSPQPEASVFRWGISEAYAGDENAEIVVESRIKAYGAAFKNAFQTRDVSGLAAFYQEFNPAQGVALLEYFDLVDELEVEVKEVTVAINGNRAVVSYTRRDTFIDKETVEAQEIVLRQSKVMGLTEKGWVILPES